MTLTNLKDARKYLKFIANKDPVLIVNWLKRDTEKQSAGVQIAPIEEILSSPRHEYATLHIPVCQMKSTATSCKMTDVECARALVIDIDREMSREDLNAIKTQYHPHLIVESSPLKYHIYWRLQLACISLEDWALFQGALAWKFGGGAKAGSDYGFSYPNKMIRVPGYDRITKSGHVFTPKILFFSPIKADYDIENLFLLFPELDAWIDEYRKDCNATKKQRNKIIEQIKLDPKNIKETDILGRNDTIYHCVKQVVRDEGLSLDDALELAEEMNKRFKAPLDALELTLAANRGHEKGIVSYHSQQQALDDMLDDYPDEPALEEPAPTRSPTHHPTPSTSSPSPHIPKAPANERNNATYQQMTELSPTCVRDASKVCGKRIFRSGGEKFRKQFKSCMAQKAYPPFADTLAKRLSLIGHMRDAGIFIHLQTKNAWGEDVYSPHLISKDTAETFYIYVLNEIVHELRKFEEKADIPDSKRFKKYPSLSSLKQLARLTVQVCHTFGTVSTQEGHLIVFQNGVLNLRDKTFTEDAMAPLKYSHPIWARFSCPPVNGTGSFPTLDAPELATPIFDAYMDNWFRDDPLTGEMLLRYFGYSMTTDSTRRSFAFFYGPSNAGKGSIARTFCRIVGDHNYCTPRYKALDPETSTFGLASMHDKLLITIDEVRGTPKEHEIRLNELKRVVNCEKVDIEFKFRDVFKSHIFGKVVMQSNEIPQYQDKGGSIKNRMIPFGFERSFGKEDYRDPADVILESEGNILATKTALAWMYAYKEQDPFRIEGSRALTVGEEVLVDRMNLTDHTLTHYIVKDVVGKITSLAAVELVQFVFDMEDQRVDEYLSRTLAQKIQLMYPEASTKRNVGRKRVRGYAGIALNKEALKKKYPMLVTDPMSILQGKMALAEALGIEDEMLEAVTDIV